MAEFYALYKTSGDAYRAYASVKNSSKFNILKVVPADSWRQPTQNIDEDENEADECLILNLNDDCLQRIFKCFHLHDLVELSQVCSKFQDLIRSYNFPKVKSYTVYTLDTSLKMISKTMDRIGPHLVDLHIDYQYRDFEDSKYLREDFEERITQKVVQYLGDNLQTLSICYNPVKVFPNKILDLLTPALRRINVLKWNVTSNCHTMQCLCSICSNLHSLSLENRKYSCEHCVKISVQFWPKLTFFEKYQYFGQMAPDCMAIFDDFIKSNPQLERMKIANISRSSLNASSKYLMNLKYLEMLQNRKNIGMFDSDAVIKGFWNLECLIIREERVLRPKEFFDRIKLLRKLKKLRLIVFISNAHSSETIPDDFPAVHELAEVVVEENEMDLRIGSNGIKIDLPAKGTILVNVINIEPEENARRNIRRDWVSEIILKMKRLFPIVKEAFRFEHEDSCQFVHVYQTS